MDKNNGKEVMLFETLNEENYGEVRFACTDREGTAYVVLPGEVRVVNLKTGEEIDTWDINEVNDKVNLEYCSGGFYHKNCLWLCGKFDFVRINTTNG